MASVSTKGSEIKKNSPPKIALSPINSSPEKIIAKPPAVKSSPTKPVPKIQSSPVQKVNSDSGKNNSLKNSKMDTTSPPKVARSPSSKSITPPSKTASKTSPGKSNTDRKNSQGDNSTLNSSLKNDITTLDVVTNQNGISDAICKNDSHSETLTTKENLKSGNKLSNNSKEIREESITNSMTNGDAVSDKPLHEDSTKGNITEHSLKDKQLLILEQNHASGDKVLPQAKEHPEPPKESSDAIDSPSESQEPEVINNRRSVSGVTLTVISQQSGCKTFEEPNDTLNVEQDSKMSEIEKNTEKEVENSKNDVIKTDEVAIVNDDDIKNDSADNLKPTVENDEIEKNGDTSPAMSSTPKDSHDTSAPDCAECSVETANHTLEPEVTKQSIRLKIWEHLESNDLVLFPRPCKGRIPNFKGAHTAAEKLTQLSFFKNSKTIKINPDKPQELARFHTLEYGKRLLVPVPRLREGLFQAVIPPVEASKYQLRQASQRYGMMKWSKPVSPDDKVHIDMVVLGSVAVDKKGHRIGKGEGFADLEFSMLVKMNAVNEDTVIVTTVHDDQVYDELPIHLFKEHDVPVDWIITPTQVIEVTEKLSRPEGIIWSILSQRRILELPVLQKVREEEQNAGKECELKDVDSDVEEKSYPEETVFNKQFTRRRRYNYSRSTGDPIRDSKLPPPAAFYRKPRNFSAPQLQPNFVPNVRRYNGPPQQPPYPPRRNFYQDRFDSRQPIRQSRQPRPSSPSHPEHAMDRPRSMPGPRRTSRPRSAPRVPRNNRQYSDTQPPMNDNRGLTKSVEVQTDDKNTRTIRQFIKRKRAPIEFSLRVKNIGTGVRVRDLKIALTERGVKPRDITWRGYRGFAFLHFVKTASKENEKPVTVDDVIRVLDGLPLPPKNKKTLVIEPAKPRTLSTDGDVESDNVTECANHDKVTECANHDKITECANHDKVTESTHHVPTSNSIST